MNDLTTMERTAYDIVAEITDMKQGNVEPCVAHISEIRNSLNVELMEALRGLTRRGVLSYHMDLNNNLMFLIKQPL